MKKSVNRLGCKCNLPGDLDKTRFVCDSCQTRYERNPTVHRWYVVWIAHTKAEMEAAMRPSRRAESESWVNGGYIDPEAAYDARMAADNAYIDPDAPDADEQVASTIIEIDTTNLSGDTY